MYYIYISSVHTFFKAGLVRYLGFLAVKSSLDNTHLKCATHPEQFTGLIVQPTRLLIGPPTTKRANGNSFFGFCLNKFNFTFPFVVCIPLAAI